MGTNTGKSSKTYGHKGELQLPGTWTEEEDFVLRWEIGAHWNAEGRRQTERESYT